MTVHLHKKWILPAIIVSQFLCTSLWFAGNAILPDIIKNFSVTDHFLATLTSVVQFGFITGTLLFAVFTISDRFSPSVVFFSCALIGALFNLAIIIAGISSNTLLFLRFFTGFFLAGIYPVGMKIAADYYQKGLGKSLGFLVGALVLGTALPHLLKSIAAEFPWRYVIISISAFAVLGGFVMLLLVADGPYRKPGQQMQFSTFLSGFADKKFRSAAFGYFGHMWELYSFWAFVPIMLATHKANGHSNVNVSLYSFLIIAGGSIACAVSGILSQQISTKKLAIIALALSCCCCLVSPFFLSSSSTSSFLVFLFFWGMVVIADSPLFSTLVAQNVAEQSRGTSLTIVNCIGFSITIISIQILKLLTPYIGTQHLFLVLALGPLSGLLALLKKDKQPVLNV